MTQLHTLGENIDTSKLLMEEHYIRIHKEAVDAANVYIRSKKPCPSFILLGHNTLKDYLMIDVTGMRNKAEIGVVVTGILHKTPQNILDALGMQPDIACFATPGQVDQSGTDANGIIFSVYTREAHGMSFSPIDNKDGLDGIYPKPITFDFKKGENGDLIPVNGKAS